MCHANATPAHQHQTLLYEERFLFYPVVRTHKKRLLRSSLFCLDTSNASVSSCARGFLSLPLALSGEGPILDVSMAAAELFLQPSKFMHDKTALS
jgi:hypothetical protein